MYHIKQDKRSETSAAMLYETLTASLKEKPIEEISITELVNKATVGRSTFYRNFDEIMDILYWRCDLHFSEVLHGYMKEGKKENFGMLEYVFTYWQNNSEILEILLSINRIDIIYDCFARNSSIIMKQLRERIDLPEEQLDYFMSIRIGVFIGVIKTWLKHGKKESAKQLSSMLGEQLIFIANNGLVF